MSEETRNPSKTVPRSMIAAVVFHFLVTYTLVTLYIFLGVPGLGALSNASVVVSGRKIQKQVRLTH
jgi:amino acid transporter